MSLMDGKKVWMPVSMHSPLRRRYVHASGVKMEVEIQSAPFNRSQLDWALPSLATYLLGNRTEHHRETFTPSPTNLQRRHLDILSLPLQLQVDVPSHYEICEALIPPVSRFHFPSRIHPWTQLHDSTTSLYSLRHVTYTRFTRWGGDSAWEQCCCGN